MTVLLCDESGAVVVNVRVTDLMRRILILTGCKSAPPASFAQFVECSHSLTRLLGDSQTFVEMGVDPQSLRTISLSVCAPAVDAESICRHRPRWAQRLRPFATSRGPRKSAASFLVPREPSNYFFQVCE